MSIWGQIKDKAIKLVWESPMEDMPAFYRQAVYLLRVLYLVVTRLAEGNITLRAMSLVYTTLLSFVPLLAVSFSVLKAFGVHNQIEPFLDNFLMPLGEQGEELGNNIIGFVDNMRVGVLGSVGLVLLLYTVISLVQKIEGAFNYIWQVAKTRSFSQAFSDYLSVIIVGPVLVFTALGMTASIMSHSVVQAVLQIEPLGSLAYALGKVVPYVLICVAFTFIYFFVPNTRVRFRAALVGGVFAGVLWEAVGWAFASFVVASTKYEAVYSSFAILIIFMIWLYISWLILLVGAQIAFYFQFPRRVTRRRDTAVLANRDKERMSLLIMYMIGERYLRNGPCCTLDELSQRMSVHPDLVKSVIDSLENNHLVVRVQGEDGGFVPARDLEAIQIEDIMNAVRRAAGAEDEQPVWLSSVPAVARVMEKIDHSYALVLKDDNLKQLIRSSPPQS
jgi:membrane protein